MASILIVEDEEHLRTALGYSLRRAGHAISTAGSGPEALAIVHTATPELVLLDVMLPELDGFEVLRRIRRFSPVPVLMLTARADEVDTVLGLELGADDYIAKPFRVRELIARIGAALRRPTMSASAGMHPAPIAALAFGNLRLDPASHQASCNGQPLSLKPRAFALLCFFMQHPNQVFSREQLLGQLWGAPFIGDPRTVDVHIRWIREQIEQDPSSPTRLHTIRNVGYQFKG